MKSSEQRNLVTTSLQIDEMQSVSQYKNLEKHSRLDIYAIQLIKHRSWLSSYEMNLIMKETYNSAYKERLHISNYRSLEKMLREAEQLKELLNVPIWKNID